jgi:LysM repeat protein
VIEVEARKPAREEIDSQAAPQLEVAGANSDLNSEFDDESRSDLPSTTPISLPQFKQPTKPIQPITKPATKPVPEPKAKRVTGASKAVRPATVMLDPSATPLRRIPWGVVGVMGVVLALVLSAVFLLRGITGNSQTGNGIQVTMQQTTPEVGEGLPTQAPAEPGAPTSDPAASHAAPVGPTSVNPTDTPAPTLPPISPTPVPPEEYSAVAGDSCGLIAEKFGVRLAAFMEQNNLTDATCTRIRIGDKFLIPAPTPTPGPSPTPQPPGAPSTNNNEPIATLPPELTYEVLPGDVCGKIAQKFPGLTTDQIIKLNNLDANCTIQIGQKLVLRFASAAAAVTAPPQVAQTPTPRTGYSAPQLVSPQAGTLFTETQTVITLQWLSVGLLKENEFYVIEIQPQGETIVPIYETKATSLKLSQELLGNEIERSFRWLVSVKQKLATNPKTNQPIYNDLSPQSEARRFVWRKPQGTPTPTP